MLQRAAKGARSDNEILLSVTAATGWLEPGNTSTMVKESWDLSGSVG